MFITQEADDAVIITGCLASHGGKLDARSISEKTGVAYRFTLKILRKLGKGGIVRSYFGVSGGYELTDIPAHINLRQVIEAVDGPIAISRCLKGSSPCKVAGAGNDCLYHPIFAKLSNSIRDQMERMTFQEIVELTNAAHKGPSEKA